MSRRLGIINCIDDVIENNIYIYIYLWKMASDWEKVLDIFTIINVLGIKFCITLPDTVNLVSIFWESNRIQKKVFLLFLVGVAFILLCFSIRFRRNRKIEDAKEGIVYEETK